MRIALAQINSTVGDLVGNQAKIVDYIQHAKNKDSEIVVFPELAICGYPPEDLLHKNHFVRDNWVILKKIAKQVTGLIAIVGFVDLDREGNLYNAAAVLQDQKIVWIYHKQELPNYGVFDEKRYFASGQNEKIYQYGPYRLGVSVCEDVWVDPGVCNRQAKAGANVLLNLSSSPYDIKKIKKRKKMLIKQAKETKSFICYANLVGGQDELVFDGGSLIVDPNGKVIFEAKHFVEELVCLDIVPEKKSNRKTKDIISLSYLENQKQVKLDGKHKKERFNQIEHINKALILGTHDYVLKNRFEKVVIGLSGGIDSALVAAIAVDALGKENVVGVSMPSRYSSKGTQTDAQRLAKSLDIEFKEIPIEKTFNVYLETLKEEFEGLESNIAEENIQARIRGNILMALSNKFGWMVLTTGNKSEIAVGYCTLYGDMSGGFAVIKDVPKIMVYELSNYINTSRGREVIPQSIIDRAPSAELRDNQKDQDSLPPYDILDKSLQAYVEEHQSFEKIESLNKDHALTARIINLVDRTEYKRRQAPPGIKITPRAFGKDWRLPITNKYKEL